jgi:hypothetical protein
MQKAVQKYERTFAVIAIIADMRCSNNDIEAIHAPPAHPCGMTSHPHACIKPRVFLHAHSSPIPTNSPPDPAGALTSAAFVRGSC